MPCHITYVVKCLEMIKKDLDKHNIKVKLICMYIFNSLIQVSFLDPGESVQPCSTGDLSDAPSGRSEG